VAIQDRITQIALAKQTSLGSPAASGTFQVGVSSGSVASVDIPEDQFDMSWSTRVAEGHDRAPVTPGIDIEYVAMPKSVGLLLLAALGNDSTAASGGNTAHVMTPANVLPYLTVFSRKGDEYHKVEDLRVNELELTWDTTKALKVKVNGIGCDFTFLGSSPFTAAADERPADGVLKGAGGNFLVNGVGAIVKSGSIKISNGVNAVHGSDSQLPADVFPEKVDITVSLTIVPENTTLFRTVVTGTAAGSTVQTKPEYGSVTCSWTDGGSSTLTFNGRNVKFMTAFPETKAQGGPVEVTLEGDISVPSGGGAVANAVDFTLVNSVSSY
jgi:hypothetical protein